MATGSWSHSCGMLARVTCTLQCAQLAQLPTMLSPPAVAGFGAGRALPETLPVPTCGLIPCQPSRQLSRPAEIPGFAVGHGFLQLFLSHWAGHRVALALGTPEPAPREVGQRDKGPRHKTAKLRLPRHTGVFKTCTFQRDTLSLQGGQGQRRSLLCSGAVEDKGTVAPGPAGAVGLHSRVRVTQDGGELRSRGKPFMESQNH